MGTSDFSETHYFSQEDRLYMEARQAEYDRWYKIHRWKIRVYVAAIIVIPSALVVWLMLTYR